MHVALFVTFIHKIFLFYVANSVTIGSLEKLIMPLSVLQILLFLCAAMEGSDFTVLMDELVFVAGSGNGTRRCVNFTAISSDMALEGFHHFLVVVNETNPPINVDEYAQYLSVYVIDNDSECACNTARV